MTEAYVPQGRKPFLPFGARSGWELLIRLEAYGCRVHGYDIRPEEDVIWECLGILKSPRFVRVTT
jgi:hypothetical protein